MPSDNVRLVTQFIEAWSSVDIDKIMAVIGTNCLYHNVPMPQVHGYDAIRENLLGFIQPVSEIEWVTYYIGETSDGVVLTERLDRFKSGSDWIEVPVMGVFEIEDTRIVSWRDYFDLTQLLGQNAGKLIGQDTESMSKNAQRVLDTKGFHF
jgi:limonene-1,2-epoxide hydrolase